MNNNEIFCSNCPASWRCNPYIQRKSDVCKEMIQQELTYLSKVKHPDMPACDCSRSTFELGGGLINGKL